MSKKFEQVKTKDGDSITRFTKESPRTKEVWEKRVDSKGVPSESHSYELKDKKSKD